MKEDYSLVGLSGLLAERPTAENYPGAWFYATDVVLKRLSAALAL
jgi:hypothetical protein